MRKGKVEVVSKIFSSSEVAKTGYLLASIVAFILAFCTLIAYTAFASTELDANINYVEDVKSNAKTLCSVNVKTTDAQQHTGKVYFNVDFSKMTLEEILNLNDVNIIEKTDLQYLQISLNDIKNIVLTCPRKNGSFSVSIAAW